MDRKLIEVHGVGYSIGDRVILENITFDIYSNELLFITGANGSGKSCLLGMLAGLVPPDRGTIRISEGHMTRFNPWVMEEAGIRTGFVFQQHSLISSLTVFENIALPLRYHNLFSENDIREKVNALLDDLEIAEYRDLRPAFLSAGIYKCVSIARTVITAPTLMIFDEPTSDLDGLFTTKILSLIQRFHRANCATSIIGTYRTDLPVLTADRKLLIRERRVLPV